MCQEEVLLYLQNKRLQGCEDYFSCKEIEAGIYPDGINNNKVKLAVRRLYAWGKLDINFKLAKKGGLMGGFIPVYRLKE